MANKKLPITDAQRKAIQYRARIAEQQRCIRIVRQELLGNIPRDLVDHVVGCLLHKGKAE